VLRRRMWDYDVAVRQVEEDAFDSVAIIIVHCTFRILDEGLCGARDAKPGFLVPTLPQPRTWIWRLMPKACSLRHLEPRSRTQAFFSHIPYTTVCTHCVYTLCVHRQVCTSKFAY
jgi:hypothetical protein